MTTNDQIELQEIRSRAGEPPIADPESYTPDSEVEANARSENSSESPATVIFSPSEAPHFDASTSSSSRRVRNLNALIHDNHSHASIATYFRQNPLGEQPWYDYIMGRQEDIEFVVRLCHALRVYGVPPHRFGEVLSIIASVFALEMDAVHAPTYSQLNFRNRDLRTQRMVSASPKLDLGKMLDTERIYKDVVYGHISAAGAIGLLDELEKKTHRHYHNTILTVWYGLACAFVGPFAFQARPIDVPIIFILGAIVTSIQTLLIPDSNNYAFAPVSGFFLAFLTSFAARSIGSIKYGQVFCYSAIAQSSVALILPGYQFLCAALEIEHAQLESGGIRMVFSIFCCFSLSIGMTFGAALWGILYKHAAQESTCTGPPTGMMIWPWAAAFSLFLILLNKAKWRQIPWMLIIAFSSYVVTYYAIIRLGENGQISNLLGAFVIGLLGNGAARLSSRFKVLHGYTGARTAAAAMLPAIFLMVPSGLAVNDSLLISLQVANKIVGERAAIGPTEVIQLFTVALQMVWIVFGITIGLIAGLFISTPVREWRKGVFTL